MGGKKLTGYPSVDKPWLKYYSEEAIQEPMTTLSIYEYLRSCNIGNESNTALVYMGRKISYKKLFDAIENTAKGFSQLGLSKGDVVACIAPSFPEVIYSFYAVNKLGAISDYFDPRTEVQTIYDELVQIKPKIFIIYDEFIEKFKDMLDALNIPNVIVVSARDSMVFPMRLLAGLKKKAVPSHYHGFSSLIKNTINMQQVETVSNIAHEVALMEHTGGTTGVPKAVCLTNQNVNSVIQQYDLGGGQHSNKESWLAVGFPFTAYALICSQHMPLVYGMTLYLCFSLDTESIAKLVLRNKINHMANTPLFWCSLVDNKSLQEIDLSFLIDPTVGADSMSIETELLVNDFLSSHNCRYKIVKGYGMTEASSGVAITFSILQNKIGSVGIPFTHTTISVFDIETQQELQYGERGEICISGPGVMKEYYNNPEETEKVLQIHQDGTVWLHSGDIGHMDEDGFLYIDGRMKRMIIDHHGFKIFAPTIERVLSRHNGVEQCCVVGTEDTVYKTGQISLAFVIPKEGQRIAENELKELCQHELPDYYLPWKFVFVDRFPYTSASKVDYRALEELAKEL